jgi:zinc protease
MNPRAIGRRATNGRTMKGCGLAGALLALLLAGPGAARGQAQRVEELHFPPLPAFAIPQPQRVVLDNGLVVFLLEDHELPLVTAQALVAAGSGEEPAAQVGLAQLTAEVLRSGGTGTLGADELDDFLEAKAATIDSRADVTDAEVTMSCLTRDFPQVLAVFADVLRRPRLAADRLEVARTRLAATIARQNDNPGSIVFREFDKIVYGEVSPYARRPTYATVAAIGRDDLVAWHRARFHPDRTVLGLVGDFDSAQALEMIRSSFGDWPRGPERQPPAAAPEQGPAPGVYFAEKDDVTQSYVAMGTLGIRRDNPDYYAVELMNEVFGGSFASRLFSNVRSKKGLAYSVFGRVGSAFDHRGLTFVYLSTKVETTGAGIAALLEEARGMVTNPPSDEEVAKAKRAILNSFIFNSDSRAKVLDQQLSLAFFGYPLDWLARYRAGIEATPAAEVRRVAAKYLHPDEFAILVVGPAAGRDRPLADFGPVTARDIAIPPPPAAAPPTGR